MAKAQQVARVTESDAEAEATTPREVRPLKPDCLAWQHDGFVWREGIVRCHDGIILQDLHDDATIWRAIQANANVALRKYDRLLIVSHDESWLVRDAMVVEADAHSVRLAIRPGDVLRMPAKNAEWSDDRHSIRWAGAGYAIFRRPDDVDLLPQRFSSLEAAKSEMYRQFYSKPAQQRVA